MNAYALNNEAPLAGMIDFTPHIYDRQSYKEAVDVMRSYPESSCIVVCNRKDAPVGLILNERFFLQLTNRSMMESYYTGPVSRLMNRTPIIAELGTPLSVLHAAIDARPAAMRMDPIIVTENGKLAGIVHMSAFADLESSEALQ